MITFYKKITVKTNNSKMEQDHIESIEYLPWNFDNLNQELLKKAEIELGETPSTKENAIRELQNLLKKKQDLNPCLDDNFLLRFLRVHKFNVRASYKAIVNYYIFKSRYSGVLTDILPSETLKLHSQNMGMTAPSRNSDGCHILLALAANFDLNVYSMWDTLPSGMLHMEYMLKFEATQICGVVMIVDFKGITWQHLVQASSPKFVYTLVQMAKAIPIRTRAIHLLNVPAPLRAAAKLFLTFMTDKIRKRFHIHDSDYDIKRLPEDIGISSSMLPTEFGGSYGPTDNSEFARLIIDEEDYYRKMNSYGYK